ncbi:MAG: hypothetical protein BHW37_02760 [Firmicutes bacterium CAG:272_52_7]|nr:MAG: hypothetical protein BHW37_02760 [Firmicutes bacterium CAG:272_52_7]
MSKKNVRRIMALLLSAVSLSGLAACAGDKKPENPVSSDVSSASGETTDGGYVLPPRTGDPEFNGMCFPMTGAESRGLNMDSLIDLMSIMNVHSMRNWMHATNLLTKDLKPREKKVNQQKEWISKLTAKGITKIVGMSHYWFWPEKYGVTDRSAAPYRDRTEGSEYCEWIALYEETWYALASAFPEIKYWEVGNEFNSDAFLHPKNFYADGKKFTLDEKAAIVTEMCFAASAGIHRANPITSGEFGNGSTEPDDYFGAVAWHCYMLNEKFDIDNWVSYNDSVYEIMKIYGDADKKVYLTEYGFSDGGSEETDAAQAEYLRQIYDAVYNRMLYVDSLYPFRLEEDNTKLGINDIEVFYGIFRVFDRESFGAKEKAKAICGTYGGDLSALDKYKGSNSVYPTNISNK